MACSPRSAASLHNQEESALVAVMAAQQLAGSGTDSRISASFHLDLGMVRLAGPQLHRLFDSLCFGLQA